MCKPLRSTLEIVYEKIAKQEAEKVAQQVKRPLKTAYEAALERMSQKGTGNAATAIKQICDVPTQAIKAKFCPISNTPCDKLTKLVQAPKSLKPTPSAPMQLKETKSVYPTRSVSKFNQLEKAVKEFCDGSKYGTKFTKEDAKILSLIPNEQKALIEKYADITKYEGWRQLPYDNLRKLSGEDIFHLVAISSEKQAVAQECALPLMNIVKEDGSYLFSGKNIKELFSQLKSDEISRVTDTLPSFSYTKDTKAIEVIKSVIEDIKKGAI